MESPSWVKLDVQSKVKTMKSLSSHLDFQLQMYVLIYALTTVFVSQWLSGRALDSRPWDRRHCVVFLSKNINPSLVLVQPRKTRPFITERLLMGRKESNETNCVCPVLDRRLSSLCTSL